ncbi:MULTISPECIES: hypothetical protein [Pseudoalteromonas]|uniref:hypothetical protein n=1 Tax=Pseudoalteromonas TaxID=53246 RepID=UPI00110B0EC1|nr:MULTISPECIES: hypothetical protein [Pseudoalteromonas]MDW7548440.1 hypothetical protein [Pseudoalteromonas peptidolytica]TMO57005.1 hypothetical protein CWC21_03705 [Pseudoalteromonas phenolica]
MVQKIHRIAAVTAFLCVVTFFASTLSVEVCGSEESIILVKSLVVFPGLFILVPCIATAGATGVALSKAKEGRVIESKKKRMPFIAFNGIFVLVPAAIFLNYKAVEGVFDTAFIVVQVAELVVGALNGYLMFLNIRDGRKLTGKKRAN